MVVVQDKLISREIFERKFICNLDACKGACCWEGDFGAPLEAEERDTLNAIYPDVRPFLSPAGVAALEAEGLYTYIEDQDVYATTLVDGGPCAYMILDKSGKAQCGIEKAHQAGHIDFKKPISCHLYPIRVKKNQHAGFEALNYDDWEICSAACQLGEEMQVPVYQFLREALVRKYGESFYEELQAVAGFLKE